MSKRLEKAEETNLLNTLMVAVTAANVQITGAISILEKAGEIISALVTNKMRQMIDETDNPDNIGMGDSDEDDDDGDDGETRHFDNFDDMIAHVTNELRKHHEKNAGRKATIEELVREAREEQADESSPFYPLTPENFNGNGDTEGRGKGDDFDKPF